MSADEPTVDDRLRLLESSVRGIVMEFDEAGHYLQIWTNDEALLARPREELLASTISEVLGKEGGAPFMELIRTILSERRPVRYEYQLNVLAGMRWFRCEGVLGRHPGTVVLLVQDVTEQKRIEAQLIESDRLAAIGLLAGGVGHEINNPLAWVMTHLRTVQRELAERVASAADPQLERWFAQLGDVLEGAERIRQIVRDLSHFTYSPEEGRRPIDLRVALDWASDIAMAELRHRARLTRQYGDAPQVASSEARLGQVFLNLLINAAHSIEPGDARANEVRVELSTDAQGRAQIDVVDTGKGIPAEHRARLFEPFFTTKPRGSGTGLGLSVSRRIVEANGGSLELISSRPGQTRFRVVLPPAKTDSPTQPLTPEIAVARPTKKPRVLLVDDQPRFLTSLRMALEHAFDLSQAESAQAALDRLRGGEPFDAVVCDLMMPDVTGMDFYEALERDGSKLLERIVFMTGGAYTERARDFLARVKNERVQKPFPPDHLEAVLLRLCQAPEAGADARPMKLAETSFGTLMPFIDHVLNQPARGSLEEISQALVTAVRERFAQSVVLARLYATVTQAELPETDRPFVAGQRIALSTSTPILSLLGSAGTQPEWNDRRRSHGHLAIPLVSDAFVQQTPMVARLLDDLGVKLEWLNKPVEGVSILSRNWLGLFHVPDAMTTRDQQGRLIIPAQDFVARHGVKTVFGVGGRYPNGRVATMILFTNETVPREVAERFLPMISRFKVATMPFAKSALYRESSQAKLD